MQDYIFSYRTKEVYALIEYEKEEGAEHYYIGRVLEFGFPDNLCELIGEYNELVDAMALSLLDEVEEKIYWYDLMLKSSGNRIFNISLKDKEHISFFLKYPTSNGFLDRYPSF
ncbi:hypothetical protein GV819_31045 [Pseudomonas sp. Fl5BN2]|uniref:hypothetical protein n=1 Tax=Pseudomonas sp. Fl5BN2 TaxID=2697652 RepID=UPI001376C3A5|nr:hypothetical protein [Pseudomonas sp. Fl5BN2]NBF06712.1 hypothetical protein [Pseudomonas sp. Fl5BN2]